MTSKNLVLRTVYIDPEVDDLLRNEAFAGRTSKNDLFRKYLSLGMEAARKAAKFARATEKEPHCPEVTEPWTSDSDQRREVGSARFG